jgi:chaperone required for assembly of F1-ATPase
MGIVPASMPLMILASTAIDHVLVDPTDARQTCLSFLPTDTALFQTTSGDRVLLAKQKESHDPILLWLHENFGVELKTTDAMVFRIQHSEECTRRMKNIVENMVSRHNVAFFCLVLLLMYYS